MAEKSKIKKEEGSQPKLTFEELERIAVDLQNQRDQLRNQLRSAQSIIAEFNEIGMLLDILDKSEHFSEDFVSRCSKKVEEIITKALDNSEKAVDNAGSN